MQMREFCRNYIVAYNLTDDESTIKFRQEHSSADESLAYVVSEAKQYRETEKVKQRRKRFEEALQALH